MFALVESGSISKYFSGTQGVTIGDNKYPKAIFTLWTKSEREAIGIYQVEMDNSKRKNEQWYINTEITYAFGSGKVTGSYGDATAKAHADTLFTAQDESNGLGTEGEVKTEGLKTQLIRTVKQQAAGILQDTDWYIIRKQTLEQQCHHLLQIIEQQYEQKLLKWKQQLLMLQTHQLYKLYIHTQNKRMDQLHDH